ncbi:MAG TPA: enoyl-CoA hydratase/isomerase family protein [Bryobacteraceae bacterium]|jgi:enoyl-CoA hydratase/carnithine racemase|nr:enoyl-CoA hydratase/isomerase family protein [Bryobacteraceae bacterium]
MGILVERKHRVLNVTLNRPEKRNALNTEMSAAIVNAIRRAQDDEHVGSILLSADGPVFCSGMDVDEALTSSHEQLANLHGDLFSIGFHSKKPIIVAVCGAAYGGGMGLVAQGHIVLASENAVFGLTEIRIGMWPFMVYRSVEAAIGARRTLELALSGRTFDAHYAQRWALVHYVCPPTETYDRAQGVARDVAKGSPAAIAAGLEYYHRSRGKSWEEAGDLAAQLRVKVMESDDIREGFDAFRQRREPQWPSMPREFYHKKQKDPAPSGKNGT